MMISVFEEEEKCCFSKSVFKRVFPQGSETSGQFPQGNENSGLCGNGLSAK